MNAAQCRMARAALQIGIRDIAKMAKVAPGTISRLEAGEEMKPRTEDANVPLIRKSLRRDHQLRRTQREAEEEEAVRCCARGAGWRDLRKPLKRRALNCRLPSRIAPFAPAFTGCAPKDALD